MGADSLRAMFRRLRRLADAGGAGLSDADLLDRFVRMRDEAAFELLLWRHGAMVLAVCRRVLRREADAEDAFQATFLALVRRANTVRRGAAVGAWLYRVAYRVALRARSTSPATSATAGPDIAAPSTPDEVAWRDLRPVLDEELRRLPARYHEAVVLCYLEGRTHAEAAREIGCPKGTIAIRLLRARKLLQTRLTRRGVTLAGLLVAATAASRAPAALVRTAVCAASGGAVSGRVASLTNGVLNAMLMTRVKALGAVILLTLGALGVCAAVLTRAGQPVAVPAVEPDKPPAPPTEPTEKGTLLVRLPSPREGVLLVIGTPLREGEKAPPGRAVAVKVGKELHTYRRLQVGDTVEEGQIVGLVDPALALNVVAIKSAALAAAQSELQATIKTKEEAERRVKAMEAANRRSPGSDSKDDLEGMKLNARHYAEEEVAKQSAVALATEELAAARVGVDMHQVRASVRGKIEGINREPGDGVRALETVLSIEMPRDQRRPEAEAGRTRDVRALRSGVLALLGAEIKPGEKVPPDQTVTETFGSETKHYRRLREGDTVEAGQLLARVDDRLARRELAIAVSRLQFSEAELRAAHLTKEEADRRVKHMANSVTASPGSISSDDLANARLTAALSATEERTKEATVSKAKAELEYARTMLATYEIRSPVRGVVRDLLKYTGEAVQAQEPALRLTLPAK